MVVGFRAQDRPRRLIGIDTAANAAMTRAAVIKIARATAELVGLNMEVRDEDIVVDPRFCGPDYGLPDEAALAISGDPGRGDQADGGGLLQAGVG